MSANTRMAASLDRRIANLSPEKRRILERLLNGQANKQTIRPRPSSPTAPLSFAQRQLWFLDQLFPGSPWYNLNVALPLRSSVNVAALQKAINEVVRRHESLRTEFHVSEGSPVQCIMPSMSIPMP